jgi:hypothetical protein
MIQWLRFAFELDTMIPMKNGQSGREEMPSKLHGVRLHRHKVSEMQRERQLANRMPKGKPPL